MNSHRAVMMCVSVVVLCAAGDGGDLTPPPNSAGRITHPIEIGDAQSIPIKLPFEELASYDRRELWGDLLKVLATEPSAIVRAETLRRAAIYALNYSRAVDPMPDQCRIPGRVQTYLAARVMDRVSRGLPATAELFDYGVFIEYLRRVEVAAPHAAPWIESVAEDLTEDVGLQMMACWILSNAPMGHPGQSARRVAAARLTEFEKRAYESTIGASPASYMQGLLERDLDSRPVATESRKGN